VAFLVEIYFFVDHGEIVFLCQVDLALDFLGHVGDLVHEVVRGVGGEEKMLFSDGTLK
jgi:hypothetical protein